MTGPTVPLETGNAPPNAAGTRPPLDQGYRPPPDQGSRPPVSVVIPTRDRPVMLARCLTSVRAALRAGDELIVVDSASRDPEAVAAVIAQHHATPVRCEQVGVDRARNAGWSLARHDLVLFTDDDVQVDEAWADAFARGAAGDPQAAFFTGWIGSPDGQNDRWEVALKEGLVAHRLDRTSRGTLGHGANMAVRRSVLVDVGGWDEALGSGGRFGSAPETDLFDRMFAAGHTGWFQPAAKAWHHQWRNTTQVIPLHFRYGVGTGARIAKLLRTDARRAVRVGWDSWWSWGLQSLGRRVRHLDKAGALVDTARLLGYAVGFARALSTPVRDGHFRPRRSRT